MSTTSTAPVRGAAAPEAPTRAPRLPEAFWLGAVLVVVVVLGVFDAAGKSLWFDEAISVAVARMPWHDFMHTVTADEANMSIYYLLLRPWIAIGGDGEAWIRLLSVVAAVGTVATLYALARRLFSFQVAIVAALLTAVNGFFVQFSQEARSYMLVAMLVTIATYAFVRGIEDGGARWWVLYGAAVTLSVYGHFFAVWFPLAHVMSMPFLADRTSRRWKPLVVTLAASSILVLPALRVAYVRRGTQIFWHPPVTLGSINGVFAAMSGSGGAVLAFATAGLGALAVFGALRLWRTEGRGRDLWHQAVALGTFAVPAFGILAICIVQKIIQIRYFSIVVPALALVVSLGIAQIRWRAVRVGAVAVMVLLASVGVVRWYDAQKEDWRSPLALVHRDAGANDAVVLFDPYRIKLVDYYDHGLGSVERTRLVYPRADFQPFPLYRQQEHMSTAQIRAMAARADTVWVLVSNADEPAEVSRFARTMAQTHRRVRTQHFSRVRVVEWQRR